MISVGDLVEYRPFRNTAAQGLGIVIKVTQSREQPNGSGDPLAEVLWMKYPGDGPQWFQVKNLRVVSSAPE